MNKLSLFIFIFSIGLFACGEATTDQEEVTTANEEQEVQIADEKADRSVEEVFSHQVEKLDERLNLSPETLDQIKGIYTDAYLAQGGNLDDRVQQDEIRDLRMNITTETKEAVLQILDENQREEYNKFFEER